jgi:magnesium transporter
MVKVTRFRGSEAPQTFPDLAAAGWRPDSSDVVWVDLEEPTAEELKLLEDPFRFHPLAIEDCVTPEHQPKIDDFGPYLFMIFRGIDFNEPVEDLRTIKLAAFLGPTYLVTYHRRALRSVKTVHTKYAHADAGVAFRSIDYLLYEILDHLVEFYFPVLDRIEDDMDAIEAELLGRCGPDTLERILSLKRRVAGVKRTVTPHREVFSRIARGEFEEIGPGVAVFYRDLYDSTARLSEVADAYRDLLSGLFEAYLSVVSNRLNEVMKVLTIFATIWMPLTFIVGVYGMNFKHFPELQWKYGYLGVWIVMLAIAGGLLWFFRRRRWI